MTLLFGWDKHGTCPSRARAEAKHLRAEAVVCALHPFPKVHVATHRFEPHTAEVRLVLEAPTREALFAEAGRALAELMLGDQPGGGRKGAPVELEVKGRDGAVLLAEWLNELVYRSEISKQVFTDFEIDDASETRVRGRARGLEPEALKTAVKAATLHGVSVERDGEGFRGAVVLDV
jgi:SHS2 domain-containing protein